MDMVPRMGVEGGMVVAAQPGDRIEAGSLAGAAGDPRAFDDLIGPLVETGYRLALAMLRDRDAAEDVLQEASLKAWRRLRQLRDGRSVRPWFLMIVSNECRRHRRARWARVIRLPQVPERACPEPAVDGLQLRQALAELPASDRMPLALFFYLDLPMEEVAQVLGVSPTAARARVYRAVRRLRLQVQEEDPA
jgi:RNA polymerase sigma factor (sigma-70 family)